MTSAVEAARRLPWGLWGRQLVAILRLELRRTFFGRRSLPVYFLAGLPVLVLLVVALIPVSELADGYTLAQARQVYGGIYQGFILRAMIFFGCVAIFTNLFRGEVLDRSLHYYLLSALRREVLVVGKYVSGVATTCLLFLSTTLVTYLLTYSHFGVARAIDDLVAGPGMTHLFAYLGVTLLACLGYGAVFLIVGLLFRNPILPAMAVLAWELMNFLLPPFLKRLSVIYYLKGLCPIPMSEGPFAVVAEPPPAWLAVIGLLLVTGAVLVVASVLVRRMEIRYSDD